MTNNNPKSKLTRLNGVELFKYACDLQNKATNDETANNNKNVLIDKSALRKTWKFFCSFVSLQLKTHVEHDLLLSSAFGII